ncbi:DNA (cytosine-5-)-methyltransferase [Streptomyces castrisilvae]|uniref:Cytosine-specific methyltransferase n=1 Tax=Streptomyces castrisilvae TaxID=3033811 RepID=A0ABY9HKH9_9ACTN|nr:DNA (cytosine-5-)-methyltransferase [Streptomyces sp. Mut1]WLQ35027.1 DNA (cytosine-5-)-methyltransferase [Streptomyces sp. Mut1]
MPNLDVAPRPLTVAGLFAGIGGVELGLEAAGMQTKLLCEWWEPAQAVLKHRFPDVALHDDIQTLQALPDVDVVTAGFPCTDLSQAGRTAGIHGKASGMVKHLLELLEDASPRWVVIENVRNMLALDRGTAMEYLVSEFERLGYTWAYRLVDSRFTGVPQRRHRVILVASRTEDPRSVLFADEAQERPESDYREDAFGFYWTEGNTGLGWAQDALPTLKGGSGLGIPSSPAMWVCNAEPGRAIVTPRIEDAEELQGFPRDWTQAALKVARPGVRWKLVGNAVTVGVSTWLGNRLQNPGNVDETGQLILLKGMKWPTAAWGNSGERWSVSASLWPEKHPYRNLLDVVDASNAAPLSLRATTGFHTRLLKSRLRYREEFSQALKEHSEYMAGSISAA